MIANTYTDILNSEVGMMLLLSIVLSPFLLAAGAIAKYRERRKR